MPSDVLFAGVAVADFPAAVTWYENLFGRPADMVVKDDEVMWRIAEAAWLYLVEDRHRAGHALVALAVADLEQTLGQMASRGIDVPPIETIGEAGRKASVADPEGNTIALIEVEAP
jgi:predicted enzyme related to lactoylglutathione lyase